MIPKKMRNHNVVKFSLDGETFTKFEDNPVIPKPEQWKDFRDPRVRFKLMIVLNNIETLGTGTLARRHLKVGSCYIPGVLFVFVLKTLYCGSDNRASAQFSMAPQT